MGTLYNVIVQGKVIEGQDENVVKENLAEIFKTSLEKIEKLLSGKPVIVKKNISQEKAEKLNKIITDTGAECKIVKAEVPTAKTPLVENPGTSDQASQDNPYKTPEASLYKPKDTIEGIENVFKGQKYLIYAILIHFASVFVQALLGPAGALVSLAAVVVGLVGFFKLAAGLGFGTAAKILLFLLMFIPLINLFILLRLNAKATKRLREAGYKVGLLGASKF